MTDSWTEDEVPRPSRTLADEDPAEDKPRLKELLEEDPRWDQTAAGPVPLPPSEYPKLQFHPQPVPEELQRQMTEREQLRKDELEHLTQLRDRIQEGVDEGYIDALSGTEMLLNISKARMALAGVGVYPAF